MIKIIYIINNPLPMIAVILIGIILIASYNWILRKHFFICSKCHKRFKNISKIFFIVPNIFEKNYLRCPNCDKRQYGKEFGLLILLVIYVLSIINIFQIFYLPDNDYIYKITRIDDTEYYQDLDKKLIYSVRNQNKSLILKNAIDSVYYDKYIYYVSKDCTYRKNIYNLNFKPERLVKGEFIYISGNYLMYENYDNYMLYEFNLNDHEKRQLISSGLISVDFTGGFNGEWLYFIGKDGYVERKNINSLIEQKRISKYPTEELYVSRYAVIYRIKNSSLLYKINSNLVNAQIHNVVGLFQTDKKNIYYINENSRFLCKKAYNSDKEIAITKVPDNLESINITYEFGRKQFLVDPNRIYFNGIDYRAKTAFYYSVSKNGKGIRLEGSREINHK